MMDPRINSESLELGPGVRLKGLVQVSIGPASPVGVLRDEATGLETVEYAVLMTVDLTAGQGGAEEVTLVFTALFGGKPGTGEVEDFIHSVSLN